MTRPLGAQPAAGGDGAVTPTSPKPPATSSLARDAPVFIPGGVGAPPPSAGADDAATGALSSGMARLSTAAAEFAPSKLATEMGEDEGQMATAWEGENGEADQWYQETDLVSISLL